MAATGVYYSEIGGIGIWGWYMSLVCPYLIVIISLTGGSKLRGGNVSYVQVIDITMALPTKTMISQ